MKVVHDKRVQSGVLFYRFPVCHAHNFMGISYLSHRITSYNVCYTKLLRFIVGEDLKAGTLVEILPEWHSEEAGIYAVYPVRKHLSGKVRALVDYLAEVFKEASWNSVGP